MRTGGREAIEKIKDAIEVHTEFNSIYRIPCEMSSVSLHFLT